MGIIVGLLILLLAFLGAPVFTLIGTGSIYLFTSQPGGNSSYVIAEMLRLASLPALIAIPLFTFAGYVLAESRAPQRMLALAEALFGALPGGLAIVALFTTALFTAFTGASGVTIIAMRSEEHTSELQ